MNTTEVSREKTARTRVSCAQQRAENIAALGGKRVLELCVGPSLRSLEAEYSRLGIEVWGNDIDPQWRDYYPKGKWLIGDARKIDVSGFDTVVVAPPLSKGCTGRREDSLRLDEVTPTYYDFLDLPAKVTVFVLPGRTLSLKEDRRQLHKFLARLGGLNLTVPLVEGVTKYVDIYHVVGS